MDTTLYSIAYDYTVVYTKKDKKIKESLSGFLTVDTKDTDLNKLLETLPFDIFTSRHPDIDKLSISYLKPYQLVIRQLIDTNLFGK